LLALFVSVNPLSKSRSKKGWESYEGQEGIKESYLDSRCADLFKRNLMKRKYALCAPGRKEEVGERGLVGARAAITP